MITIELAGPPRGKGRGRAFVHKGTGRVTVMTPAITRSYEAQLRYAATLVMTGPPLEGPVQLIMWVRFPIPESWSKKKREQALAGELLPTVKPDADNTLKLTDALNEICWRDDKQVVDARVIKRYSDHPGMTIQISPYVVGQLFDPELIRELRRTLDGGALVDILCP